MRTFLAALAGVSCLLHAALSSAEPILEHVEPASIARGHRNRVALVGSGVDRAVGIWTSLPAGKLHVGPAISSDATGAEFEIQVDADCPLGMYGLRLATEDGLSNLHLFAVDDILPRASLADPQVEFPVAVAGVFRPADADRYRIQVQAGQRLAFDVIASRLGTDADPLITIYDPAGRRLLQRDNDPGLFFDCAFDHRFEKAGIYTVEVRDSRFEGSPHWRYVLRMGDFPTARVALPSAVRPGETTLLRFPELAGVTLPYDAPRDLPPGGFFFAVKQPSDAASSWVPLINSELPSVVESEPNDSLETAVKVDAVPALLHGVFDKPGDLDYFALELKKGDKLTFRAETRPVHSAADVELVIFDPTGKEALRVDDVALPGGALDEAVLNFTANRDGRHCLLVREMSEAGGPQFTYRVEAQLGGPKFQLSTEAGANSVPQQSYQMVPIVVTRTEFNGPIELSLVNAPPGIKLEPTTIPEAATSLYCKLSAAADAPLGIGAFTIVGKAMAGDKPLSANVATQPMVDRQRVNVDLIKHALRANQRWLPSSVTDRLALQVLPPAPFNVDLTDETLVLPRYQQVDLKMAVSRVAGFDGPISFTASGGQVGKESEGRRQVFARLPDATASQTAATVTFHSRSQANDANERADVVATGKHGDRTVTLRRCLTLAVKPAFELTVEPKELIVEPGAVAKFSLVVARLPSFARDVTVTLTLPTGVTAPETVTIPAGQTSVAVEATVAEDFKPRKDTIRFMAVGTVSGYQEELRPVTFGVEVKPPPKTK